MIVFFFFFFQAEDGIRDLTVTGVQTCALPIYRRDGELAGVKFAVGRSQDLVNLRRADERVDLRQLLYQIVAIPLDRSEERRVGKECRSRWTREHSKKKRARAEQLERSEQRLTS